MLWKMLYKMKAFNGWVLRSGDDGNIIYDLLYCYIFPMRYSVGRIGPNVWWKSQSNTQDFFIICNLTV